MAKDRTYLGEKTTQRLVDRSRLKRVSVPGGGEAFQGETASRALKALGARAMTVDQSIIVSEDFDAQRPEDAALYAHEKLHVDRGSTQATHAVHDAEEVAARAAEEMVLHRMASGESAADVQRSPQKSAPPAQGPPADPLQKAIALLQAQGGSRLDLVDNLARQVVNRLAETEDLHHDRGADSPGSKGH